MRFHKVYACGSRPSNYSARNVLSPLVFFATIGRRFLLPSGSGGSLRRPRHAAADDRRVRRSGTAAAPAPVLAVSCGGGGGGGDGDDEHNFLLVYRGAVKEEGRKGGREEGERGRGEQEEEGGSET